MKNSIYNYDQEALEEYFLSIGDKKYRAVQILEWLYRKRVDSFEEMTNLSKLAKQDLIENFTIEPLTLEKKLCASDGTIKYLFKLEDGHLIETVLMRHNYGNSVCVTSQVGCNMGCSFCASGELGKVRDLDLSEMMRQVLYVQKELDKNTERVTNVVVMGIGEPFDNYDTVIKFVKTLNYGKGFEIGARHITISTCGIVPKIKAFKDENLQVNLAISLHAPNNELRSQIMKINKAYPLEEVMAAAKEYVEATNRRITFEYILLEGINDTKKCAYELINLIRGMNAYVNLIPYNKVVTKSYRQTSHDQGEKFFSILYEAGINVTMRMEHGNDINAACGQLRAQELSKKGEA